MKLGVISPNLMGVGFEEGLQYAQNLGLQAIEVAACGPAASDIYCDRERLVADKGEVRRWLEVWRSVRCLRTARPCRRTSGLLMSTHGNFARLVISWAWLDSPV